MYQINFSEQSLGEIEKFDKERQLQFVSLVGEAADRAFRAAVQATASFQRDGKTFHRLKVDNFRLYVEKNGDDGMFCHYILPQHTLSDFLFRSKFPVSDEQMVEQHSSFWKYLESLKK
jgi:mRNA interferase RelE/StbE